MIKKSSLQLQYDINQFTYTQWEYAYIKVPVKNSPQVK